MSSKLVAFLIGPSDSIGAALIKTWKTNGYAVAIGSRSLTEKKDGADYATKIDVTNPKSITEAFSAVTKDVGAPNVVVYNSLSSVPIDCTPKLTLFHPQLPSYSQLPTQTTF